MRKTMLLGLVGWAAAAFAVPTTMGMFNVPLSGTTAAAQPELAGSVVTDQSFALKSGGAHPIVGSIQVRVTRGQDGKLTFAWRIINEATSGPRLTQFFLLRFPNGAYDVNWRSDGLGDVAPTSVSGSNGVSGDGYYHSFQFPRGIGPGQSSRFIFLRTNATEYRTTDAQAYVNGDETNSNHVAIPVPVLGSRGRP